MEKTVLIVEDDPRNLKLIQDVLQVSGYQTLAAVDGQQALELARKRKPDLILMDIQLPVIDGLEATKILKADPGTRRIPIIALTALAMHGDKEKILQAGCDDYFSKPVDIHALLEKIKDFIPHD